ncbi:hypothetical protein NQ318_013245 [Aromia moschata]|uniref:THAP-type domain-containing protein n=1 Tax=Aromia moschata TaxID=1265417 RepID=A0AAV8XT73_9CUCU|nr:hypothetical protein NQ318_013245 [Aromia moschata]
MGQMCYLCRRKPSSLIEFSLHNSIEQCEDFEVTSIDYCGCYSGICNRCKCQATKVLHNAQKEESSNLMSNKKSYGDVCCVINCKNRARTTSNVKYYSFSVNPNKLCQREKWIRAVKRSNYDGRQHVTSSKVKVNGKYTPDIRILRHEAAILLIKSIYSKTSLRRSSKGPAQKRNYPES